MADSNITEMPDSWLTDCLTVANSSSLLNTKILVETKNSVVDDEIREVDLENNLPKTLTCEPCKKVYLTKGGYDRHIRRVHQTANIKLDDSDLETLLLDSLKELSDDPCFPLDQQSKWRAHKFSPNPSLFSSIRKIYKKLKNHVNAEKFYTEYYGLISINPTPFPGLDHLSSVELLRKTGDKILSHFQKAVRNNAGEVPEEDVPAIQENEFEALEYLGGYVIRNLEKKAKRKSNSDAYLEILCCFESDGVEDQPLISLLDRGGLRGITKNTKNIFTKAELEFRRYTKGDIQNIAINGIVKNLMNDIDVTGNFYAVTDHIVDLKEEVLFNVVESMLIVYLRVRSFSYVRDLTVEKKKEKDALLKEKSLRKTLKKKINADE